MCATRPAAPSLVSVRGLSLRRGRTEVLHDIDLDVRRGEFVAVVGANGAGKTSLIQAIAGVVPPPRGTVHVDGLDVGRSDTRALASRIGFVFQNPEHQFIANTVYDELAHGLRLRRLPDAEVRERTEGLLERFGLTAKAQTHPFLLSGGQKRRLSVGTALVAGAPVLALDEPTFGQDRARADELIGAPSRTQSGWDDGPRRHARHAARRRVRRPDDRDGGRPNRRARRDRPRCSTMRTSSNGPGSGRRRWSPRCGGWRGIPNWRASHA